MNNTIKKELVEIIWNNLRDVACSTKRKASCIPMMGHGDVVKAVNQMSDEDWAKIEVAMQHRKLSQDAMNYLDNHANQQQKTLDAIHAAIKS